MILINIYINKYLSFIELKFKFLGKYKIKQKFKEMDNLRRKLKVKTISQVSYEFDVPANVIFSILKYIIYVFRCLYQNLNKKF